MYPTSHPSPHFELGLRESAALEPTRWERWIDEAERILGRNPDGDQGADGYSLDAFHNAFERGLTPGQAATLAACRLLPIRGEVSARRVTLDGEPNPTEIRW